MAPLILCLNPGSSSIKAKLFNSDLTELRVWKQPVSGEAGFTSALKQVMAEATKLGTIQTVGCRVVDGGAQLTQTCFATGEVVATLEQAAQLAPLHAQESLDVIRAVQAENPHLPVVLAFDTSFHRTLPKVASTYPLPQKMSGSLNLRRLGFHGLAYQSVVAHLTQTHSLPKRLIAIHLGSGCSACAILDGKSVDTTMGFTPLEGLMMGTRSGSIDPGILLYLLDHGYDSASLSRVLNHESGLLGVSGISADVRELEQAARDGNPAAREALDLFCYLAAKQAASLAVAMDGVDGICFSGGIGENSAFVRGEICRRLAFLGAPPPLVVAVDEELEIGREVLRLTSRS